MELYPSMGINPSTRQREQVLLYTYENYREGIECLAKQINSSKKPDFLCALHRGGLVPGVHLSYKLRVPLISIDRRHRPSLELWESILTNPRLGIIMIDEQIDSGETCKAIHEFYNREFKWACLIQNVAQEIVTDPYFHMRIDRKLTSDYILFHWEND